MINKLRILYLESAYRKTTKLLSLSMRCLLGTCNPTHIRKDLRQCNRDHSYLILKAFGKEEAFYD
jgi:hypothetical protein